MNTTITTFISTHLPEFKSPRTTAREPVLEKETNSLVKRKKVKSVYFHFRQHNPQWVQINSRFLTATYMSVYIYSVQ